MLNLTDPLPLKYKQVRDFLVKRFNIPALRNLTTFEEINMALARHSEIIVILNHDQYNIIVIEQRDNKSPHIPLHRIGLIFTAPAVHPTQQFNYVNMLECEEVIWDNTFFEISTANLMACCGFSPNVDDGFLIE